MLSYVWLLLPEPSFMEAAARVMGRAFDVDGSMEAPPVISHRWATGIQFAAVSMGMSVISR
jgi:hypothetical protein